MTTPAITILTMATPDGSSEMGCMSCGMEWTSLAGSSGASQHVNDHHYRCNVEPIRWGDRHKHFARHPHDPHLCSACGAETISSQSGRDVACMCALLAERRDHARRQCAACDTEANMAAAGLVLSNGDPYRIPPEMHACGTASS